MGPFLVFSGCAIAVSLLAAGMGIMGIIKNVKNRSMAPLGQSLFGLVLSGYMLGTGIYIAIKVMYGINN